MVRTAGGVALVSAVAFAAAGCSAWKCDFESHGACIEFVTPPADLQAAKGRVDVLLDSELAFWGLSKLDGWRVQFRDSVNYECYFSSENEGCTDYLDHTLSVRVPPEASGCFEAAELLHELGHYELGDPMHSSPRWHGVEAAFAPIVWDHPGAAPECVARYRGITLGVWTVRYNSF